MYIMNFSQFPSTVFLCLNFIVRANENSKALSAVMVIWKLKDVYLQYLLKVTLILLVLL